MTSGLSWFFTLGINRLLSDFTLTLVTFRKAPYRVKWVVMLIKSAFWVTGLEMQGLQVMWHNPLVNREETGSWRTSEASPGPARVPALQPAADSWCPCCHWGAGPGLHSGYDRQLECCVLFSSLIIKIIAFHPEKATEGCESSFIRYSSRSLSSLPLCLSLSQS